MPHFRKQLPSFERLHELLAYEPDTGIFRWNPRVGKSAAWHKRISQPAGWHDTLGYLRLKIDGSVWLASRIAWVMTHRSLAADIDHINGDTGDCRIANLRPVTHRQNTMNRVAKKNKMSGLPKGVFQWKSGKFFACIRVMGKLLYLGTHDQKCEAQYAYAMAARSKFGKYARV